MISQEQDYTRHDDSPMANSPAGSRVTANLSVTKLSLNIIGGSAAGKPGLFLTGSLAIVGRDEECDLVLEGETVSRHHCEIRREGVAYFLKDVSRNGTFVNNERILQRQLNHGDQIRIGGNLLLVKLSSGTSTRSVTKKMTEPSAPPPPIIRLKPHIVVKGFEEGVTQSFGEDQIIVGRREGNQIVLDADNISRNHAAIERRDAKYYIRDLGSANGTRVNETRVEEAELQHGDSLRIGDFILQVQLLDEDCILSYKKKAK